MGSASVARSPVERLLERLRPHRSRRLSGREVRMEITSGLLLALASLAIAVGFDGTHSPTLLDVSLLIMLTASLSRVKLYVGGGFGMPTQLALLPMLYLLPPVAVPIAMAAGLCLGTLADVLAGRCHPDRMLSSIGDAWHAVGPALVFAIAGAPDPAPHHWLLLVP